MYVIYNCDLLTVKLTKPWTPEIFMECYYVVINKPIRHEKTKPQRATVIAIIIVVLRFACVSRTLLWLLWSVLTVIRLYIKNTKTAFTDWLKDWATWTYETIPVKFQLSSFLFSTPRLCSAVCFNKMVLKAWPHFEIDWDYKPLTSDC